MESIGHTVHHRRLSNFNFKSLRREPPPPPTVPPTPLSCLVVYKVPPLPPSPPPLTSCKGGLTKGEKVNVLLAISLAHDPGPGT